MSFSPNEIINLDIVFEIKSWPVYTNNGFTLRNHLSGAVKLNKNSDPDKDSYSGYHII